MALIVTPPEREDSLWQADCHSHGLLIHAHRRAIVVMTARFHEHEFEGTCILIVSGLRCMFCARVQDVYPWPENLDLVCDDCERQIKYGVRREDYSPSIDMRVRQ